MNCPPQKKAKKELRIYEKIPIWICEYHHEVLPYIYRAIGSKHLPFVGNIMVHFDSHPDLMAPTELQADCIHDKNVLFDIVSIADWILPAVYAGHIKKVVWIKPPWSKQISDKTIICYVGRHKTDGLIRISCCETYFCDDGMYAPLKELENCKQLDVVVITMHFDTLSQGNPENISSVNSTGIEKLEHCQVSGEDLTSNVLLSTDTCNGLEKSPENPKGDFVSALLPELEGPFILDIDMDFFSTLNPFQQMFTKEEFAILRNFYLFPYCNSELEKDMKEVSDKHQENIKKLEDTLLFLKNGCDGDMDSSINVEFLEFIKNWSKSRSHPVDYEMVHSAGMTTELPVHISDEQEVIKMMDHLQNSLTFLQKPTIITVARSSDDDYTPPQSVEMIQDLFLKCLKNTYKDIECFFAYLDE